MVPGMGHCAGGLGAWKMGQAALVGTPTDAPNLTDHNVLLSLVDWVEGGHAPPFMIGTDEAGQGRKHCLWPSSKSVWTGSAWDCVPA
jgi:feruloyl esterase